MRILYSLAALLLVCFPAFSQNDFRTRQSGAWNASATWEEFIGGSWQVTSNTPSTASGVVTIRSPHNVTIGVNVNIDQIVVLTGGAVTVSGGVVVTVNNGSGVDVVNSGTISTTNESQLIFEEAAEYD